MHYYSYDLPSAVTEERLASVVCASVKDYLGEVTDYVARCQAQAAQQQEIINVLEEKTMPCNNRWRNSSSASTHATR